MSVFHEEKIEIAMENVNVDASARKRAGGARGVTPAVSGGMMVKAVVVSFGLLCTLQVTINVCLRFYSSDDKAAGLDKKVSSLQISLKNLIEERDKLKRKLKVVDEYSSEGWVYFRDSLYSVSSIMKNWQDSRDDCLQRGADLMIINSKEEQDFAKRFKKQLWIGLNDIETEGTWKWLDGTPLNSSYWGNGEPNHYNSRNEDCGEIKYYDLENSLNDLPCQDKNFWICEKVSTQ
ncbi:C-type lectin domain family 4 member K-like isoform X2 [Genypterus blacodes]|uniref:C-type lectin domain family 4 member K-like isoform X2 n=1 Tax=Genypterus blacodes TaxID=154954 RepID=UPI003F764FD6